ncbi:von Willebrand factor type A, partial [Trinorchestia longiramus]
MLSQPSFSYLSQIIVFSTHVRSLGVFKAEGRELKRGIHKVRSLDAYGGTNINEALLSGIADIHDHSGDQQYRQLVFLTDGKPTVNEKNTDVIRRNVREANVNSYPIFALAFGPDAELKFLRQICADNTGVARRITNRSTAADQIQEFFNEVSQPLLSNVTVSFPEGQVNESTLVTL